MIAELFGKLIQRQTKMGRQGKVQDNKSISLKDTDWMAGQNVPDG